MVRQASSELMAEGLRMHMHVLGGVQGSPIVVMHTQWSRTCSSTV